MAVIKRLKVASLGLSEREQRVLKSVFGILGSRARSYELSAVDLERPADIYIVNGEDKIALAQLRKLREIAPRPALFVTDDDAVDGALPCVRRPMVASKLVAALNSLADGLAG
jgi:hypothetical protein